jgi:hypothetical protein
MGILIYILVLKFPVFYVYFHVHISLDLYGLLRMCCSVTTELSLGQFQVS